MLLGFFLFQIFVQKVKNIPSFSRHVQKFCDGVVTVTDDEIKTAAAAAYNNGLVVETSGAAGLAAFMTGKICRTNSEEKIVIVITGGNISPEEMTKL